MMAMPAAAQNDVVVSPSPLSIAATLGDTSVNRSLTLSVADNITVTNIQSTYLVSGDNVYTIPSSAINATVPNDELANEGIGLVPVSIQLEGIHSGTFTGNLIVMYHDEEEKRENLEVPVNVTVKDGYGKPLAVLIIGVLIGGYFFVYSGKGKRKDEIETQYENLLAVTSKDEEYTNFETLYPSLFFPSMIRTYLGQADLQLRTPALDQAETSVKAAYDTWGQWLQYRSAMIRQVKEEHSRLLKNVDNLGTVLKSYGEFKYLQTLRDNLDVSLKKLLIPRTFPLFETAFTTFTTELMNEKNSYKRFSDLSNLILELGKEKRNEDKVKQFWTRLRIIGPGDPQLQVLEGEVTSALLVMHAHPASPSVMGGTGTPAESPPPPEKGKFSKWWDSVKTTLGKAVSWVRKTLGKGASRAKIRLGIFSFVSIVVLLVLLVIIGFQQLYLANPTFGAGLAEYIALFLWGLGVGPASDATVKSVRDQFVV